jgi:GNAT superfamily N-acetyltransferase
MSPFQRKPATLPRRPPEPAGLRDGQEVQFRQVTNADAAKLLEFLDQLSPASRRSWFFSIACDVSKAAHWAASADGTEHVGILAIDATGWIIGHAASCRVYGRRAHVAVAMNEAYRQLGLGPILIARLAREAEEAGVETFLAEALPENREMLAVFHDGADGERHTVLGDPDIEFPTGAWRRLEASANTELAVPAAMTEALIN